ncbi:MAG: N-(5 -phosphoribosyl)anthranilate isomerase [Candidatus Aramenus sulfurataquae]|uniref:N-(5'-phosphoribosyl)anthranilate isomerase n=2 Tax=Candidatus Aramenus sulfurataquae TaxID=1326980 RepID=W7L5W7_9CREN|nr:MAG: N-(5 -phosphoribosyl)anthranilate isomerase [Candidatus Aramenus sulfurataquae]MCL7344035.1 N-(5'-phosphoribosyl)anthranilate isomerase [Candidatus Aramenus sulfurataquae]
MKVKICGISTLLDIVSVSKTEVDFLGVVIDNVSPRFAKPEFVSFSKRISDKPIVAVKVKGSIETIVKEGGEADFIQIHRVLSEAELEELTTYNKKFILYVPGSAEYYKYVGKAYMYSDLVLLDSPRKGERLNLEYAKEVLRDYPDLGLAGGINEENVKQFVDLNPGWIDVSSGVEVYPGKKDLNKVKKIVGVAKWKSTQ